MKLIKSIGEARKVPENRDQRIGLNGSVKKWNRCRVHLIQQSQGYGDDLVVRIELVVRIACTASGKWHFGSRRATPRPRCTCRLLYYIYLSILSIDRSIDLSIDR